jgi:arylsulfatase A-like enzyme
MRALVIVAGGLQLGYVGAYGNEWVATPNLDRLAAEGVVFDQHHADRPDAAGARRGWRSGRYGLPTADGRDASPREAPADLLGLLRERGVRTSLVVDGSRPTPAEFAAGWDNVDVVSGAGEGTPLERTLEAAVRALDRLAAVEDWLLWIDLETLLPPWDVPAEFGDRYFGEQVEEADGEAAAEEPLTPLTDPATGPLDPDDDTTFLRLQRTYAGVVTYLDAGLGLLLDELRERGLLDQVAVIFTSDRGLPLGEHGIVGECRPWLHDELVHVPLILRLPGAVEAGRRVPALTQPVDVMPTLLDLFGAAAPTVHGQSLLPLARGEVEQVRAYACSGLRADDAGEWALISPEWKFILPLSAEPSRAAQLYVKPDDRWEVNDVLQHHPELSGHMEQVLCGFVEATARPGPLRAPELRDVEGEPAAAPPGGEAGAVSEGSRS